jgi:hypothetical protein
MGILGIDVLKHYCIQLDFAKRSVCFLDDESVDKSDWGQPFHLTDFGNGCLFIDENLLGEKGSGSLIDTGYGGDGWLNPELFQQWTGPTALLAMANGKFTYFPNGVLAGEVYHALDLKELVLTMKDPSNQMNGIGLHVLSQNLVTLDFPKKTMYLKRTGSWPLFDEDFEMARKSAPDAALKFLQAMWANGEIPGWSKEDKGTTTTYHFSHLTSPYLDSVTWNMRKNGDLSLYHYTATRTSHNGSWKL